MPEPIIPNTPTTQPNQFLLFLKHTGWLLLAGVPVTLFLFLSDYLLLYWIPSFILILAIVFVYVWYIFCIYKSFGIYRRLDLKPQLATAFISMISIALVLMLPLKIYVSAEFGNFTQINLSMKCDQFEILKKNRTFIKDNSQFYIFKNFYLQKVEMPRATQNDDMKYLVKLIILN